MDDPETTFLVRTQGHPRILERLAASVASRGADITWLRCVVGRIPGPAWIALTVTLEGRLAGSLQHRIAALPNVLAVVRVEPVTNDADEQPSVTLELERSGFRATVDGRCGRAPTPEGAVAEAALPPGIRPEVAVVELTEDGVLALACVRDPDGLRAAAAKREDVAGATAAAFTALATALPTGTAA